MQRLIPDAGLNSSQEYDKIYLERSKKQVDSQDMKRWRRLLKYYKGGKILDAGCLDSKVVELIVDKKMYWGIDIAEKAIASMQVKYPEADYSLQDLYKTDFKNESFEYVVLGEVLEHLENVEFAIKESFRVLKRGGYLALSVPLEEIKEPGAVDGLRHLYSFSVKDIINLLKPYGSTKVSTLGSEFFPVYKYHWKTLLGYCKKK